MESYVTAEISVSAVRANLALLRSRLAPGAGLCAVVKADCYGHGWDALAREIDAEADMLAVATGEEALALRQLGCDKGVLMLLSARGFSSPAAAREAACELLDKRITFTLAGPEDLEIVAAAAAARRAEAVVHVKVDTAMARGGVWHEQAADFVARVRRTPGLRLAGIYTHFATADEADKAHALAQLALFRAVLADCGPTEGLTLHAANSAALIDLPQTHLDMVRPGIALYGCSPSNEMRNTLPLRPAMRVVSRLMLVKDVPAGTSSGYGLTHTFGRPSRIGLVPIGYADGYPRSLSDQAVMRLAGREAPVCGRVSMDQVVLDLTDLPAARAGDEVEVLSADPAAPNSAEALARLAGTIPYVITCGFGKPRVRHLPVE